MDKKRKDIRMKLLLTTLNSKYIHTNLAIRYLKNSVVDVIDNVNLVEFTINQRKEYILGEIYKIQPDVIGFSCYIWNIEMIHEIAKLLKKVMPHITIIFGGPEVSFSPEKIMQENDAIDMIIMGEGEKTFKTLIQNLKYNEDYSQIPGMAFRAKGEIFINNKVGIVPEMEQITFPYKDEIIDKNKIVYYESSRGCPFNCQYCLSSTSGGVRFRPLEIVKEEIKYLVDQGVQQVKFVDRTFNAKKDYAMEIMEHIIAINKGKTNFHFEVTADLIEEDMLEFLSTVPTGLFQFEIGVQSTNQETLKDIQRQMDFDKLGSVVKRISKGKNIHQHLDLIVGLPREDYFSFRKSFDDVFTLRPEKLQIGFLKLLKGSGIRRDSSQYQYIYDDKPPYEVLESDAMSYGEIVKLKGMEEMVEVYWNSNMFASTVEIILENFYDSSFKFFEDLWEYWEALGYHHLSHSRNKLYEILLEFYSYKGFEKSEVIKEVLKFDYIKHNKTTSLPGVLYTPFPNNFKNKCHEFLQEIENLKKYLPKYMELPAKEIIKKVYFQHFDYNVILLEEKPEILNNINKDETILLFDYNIENKAIEQCRYFRLPTIEFI